MLGVFAPGEDVRLPRRGPQSRPGDQGCVCPGGKESSRIHKPLGQPFLPDSDRTSSFLWRFLKHAGLCRSCSPCMQMYTWLAPKHASKASHTCPRWSRRGRIGVEARGMRSAFAPEGGGAIAPQGTTEPAEG